MANELVTRDLQFKPMYRVYTYDPRYLRTKFIDFVAYEEAVTFSKAFKYEARIYLLEATCFAVFDGGVPK